MKIKKWNATSTAWETLSPQVTYTDIVDDVTANTPSSIFDSGKLKEAYLPDYIFGGLKFKAATAIPTSGNFASTLISLVTAAINEGGDAGSIVGSYYIATSSGTWPTPTNTNGGSGAIYVTASANAPVEEDQNAAMTVEAGDWVVISSLASGDGQSGTPLHFKLGIINNQYSTATSSKQGIIQLGFTQDDTNKRYPVQLSSNKAYVEVPWQNTDTNTTYSLAASPGASNTAVIRLSDGSTNDDVTITAGSNITISNESSGGFTLSATDTNTTYGIATSTTAGLIELFSNTDQTVAANSVTSESGRTYGIQLNSSNQAVVNVPWVNSTYTAGTGIKLQANQFSQDAGVGISTTTNGVKMTYPIAINDGSSNPASTFQIEDGALWFDLS